MADFFNLVFASTFVKTNSFIMKYKKLVAQALLLMVAIQLPAMRTNWDKDHRRVNWIDPRPFLNGAIDVDYKIQTSSRFFYNIICD